MERMIFVLPTCNEGTPQNVDEFLEDQDLLSTSFENMSRAEQFMLDMKEKYRKSKKYKNFAIFENTAHAVPSPCGYQIICTVRNQKSQYN